MREPVERALAEAKEERDALAARWAKEKEALERIKDATRRIDELRMEAERAEREGNLQRVAEIRYGEIPALEQRAGRAQRRPSNPMVKEEVDEDDIAMTVVALDGDPGRPAARRRDREADPHRGAPPRPRRRPGRSSLGGRQRAPALPHRPAGPEPADRLVRLPRPDRRRQDRARAGARRVHVRRRARDGAARHVGVPGAPHRFPARRRAARLRRLRGRRPADRGGPAPALLRRPARRDREGARRGVRRAAAGARRRPPDRRPGAHGRLPQQRADHDVERPQRRGDARPLPPRVPEPDRRDRRVQGALTRADRRDRRASARPVA